MARRFCMDLHRYRLIHWPVHCGEKLSAFRMSFMLHALRGQQAHNFLGDARVGSALRTAVHENNVFSRKGIHLFNDHLIIKSDHKK